MCEVEEQQEQNEGKKRGKWKRKYLRVSKRRNRMRRNVTIEKKKKITHSKVSYSLIVEKKEKKSKR